MRKSFLLVGAAALALMAAVAAVHAQQKPAAFRVPATPLVAHDPYFSIWSTANHLADGPTRHWTGAQQELNGFVRVDGKNYRYLGDADRAVPALEEASRKITPTRTIVTMQNQQIELSLTFFTPAFPEDLLLLSRPVTYLTWQVKSRDGAPHDVTLYLDAGGALATDAQNQPVVWSRSHTAGLQLLRIGSQRQSVLEKWGDDLRIDWGYFYLAAPEADGAVSTLAGNTDDRRHFLETGALADNDDLDQPRMPQSRYPAPPMLAVALSLGRVSTTPATRHLLLAYDDGYSIEYMHQKLRPYWRKGFPSFAGMLQTAEHDYPALTKHSESYDAELENDLTSAGGPEYAAIAVLAFRQAIAAHKLVEAADGVPFFMPKENFSNGSISTVDVLYPSTPMFLLLSPKLVEAQLEPVARYAETSHWKFPFAPHDLGVYPLANGQLYGGGEDTEDDQMPVEESGNMILMFAALAHVEHNADYASRHWPLLTRWADFLMAKGMDPENQLCTDDFAGHLAHNANLSIKAIEALASYAQMAEDRGDHAAAAKYGAAAKAMAEKWVALAADGDHYRLAFDKPGTWSQKYNLVWDQLLGLNIFPAKVRETEIAFYKGHLNEFGLPLDSRESYTKLDWQVWTATLADKAEDFQTLFAPIPKWVNEGPTRVPLTDWYDTKSGKMVGFQARSVVGGVYIKALADKDIAGKWQGLAR
jgi:hypothetical protein